MIWSRIGSPAFAKTVAGREPPNVDLDPLSRSCDWRTWHATNTPVPLPMAADRNGSGGVPATWRPARRKAARRPRCRGHGSAHPPPRGSRGTPQAAVRLPGGPGVDALSYQRVRPRLAQQELNELAVRVQHPGKPPATSSSTSAAGRSRSADVMRRISGRNSAARGGPAAALPSSGSRD